MERDVIRLEATKKMLLAVSFCAAGTCFASPSHEFDHSRTATTWHDYSGDKLRYLSLTGAQWRQCSESKRQPLVGGSSSLSAFGQRLLKLRREAIKEGLATVAAETLLEDFRAAREA
jgi:hypothetical protein